MVEDDLPDQFLPSYISLLDDMDAYLHKGVSIFMKWFCYIVEDMDPPFIPEDLVPIFYLKIIISPKEIPIFSVPLDPREVVFGGNRFGVHVLEADDLITHVHLNVLSYVATLSQTRFYNPGWQTNMNSMNEDDLPTNDDEDESSDGD
uniref:Uncharacterized protein n=1 Tax=Chenopodium quinoa TaxID=63459 RepID=A0A803MYW1_CHEQI